jgi:AraC-like DNA-binding protein
VQQVNVLDPMVRLFESLADPTDVAILGELVVDEIHYRILRGERGSELRTLLQQRGQIQRISKAVEYIHQNLDKPVSVEQLAEMVHMSRTSFYETFRDVMHLSPLRYARSMNLVKSQTLIKEGKKANEAGYLVGYNCPSQFSWEYKRHFGFAPSATWGPLVICNAVVAGPKLVLMSQTEKEALLKAPLWVAGPDPTNGGEPSTSGL